MKKVSLILKIAFTFLFAFMISFNILVDKAMATGDFSQSCENMQLDNSTLTADCRKINGSYQATSIYLDNGIGNLDGILSWGDRNFSQTCKDIGLSQSLFTKEFELAAKCQQAIGGDNYTQTYLSLDEHIANIDGTLTYE